MDMNNVEHQGAKIKVIGIGGGGNNIVNHMVREGLYGVEYIAINTDEQVLALCQASSKIKIGKKGLGAGANPEVGRRAAEESLDEIKELVEGTEMVFIAAGMGGGTGTGAAPVVAALCREMGILTVGVVTKPFSWEGTPRMEQALKGIAELNDNTDAIIVIPNNKLKDYIKQKSAGQGKVKSPGILEAFRESDNVTRFAVQGICDLIQIPGLINLDFEDVKTTLQSGGSCLMGIGTAKGEDRAKKATLAAMHNPLLEHGIDDAKAVIFNVTGGNDFSFDDLDEASDLIYDHVDKERAKIIVGAVIKEELEEGEIQVTVVATGFDHNPSLKGNEANKTKNVFGVLPQEEKEEPVQEKRQVREIDDITDDGIPSFLLGKRRRN